LDNSRYLNKRDQQSPNGLIEHAAGLFDNLLPDDTTVEDGVGLIDSASNLVKGAQEATKAIVATVETVEPTNQ